MSLAYILFVRENSGDIDDTEYYVKHVVCAVLPESDKLLYYRSMPNHDAVRELCYDGTEWLRAWDTLTMFEATVCGRSWVQSPTGAI